LLARAGNFFVIRIERHRLVKEQQMPEKAGLAGGFLTFTLYVFHLPVTGYIFAG